MAIIYLGWAQALACSSGTWFVLGEGSHNTKSNCRLGDKLPKFGAPELEGLIKRVVSLTVMCSDTESYLMSAVWFI